MHDTQKQALATERPTVWSNWVRGRRFGRRFPVVALASVAMLATGVLAGCGSSSSSSSAASTSSPASPATSSTATSSATTSAATSSATSTTFTAICVCDLTGPTKFYGSQDLLGMQAAAEYWNAHGGIGGRKIVVSGLSDNGDPTTAVSVLLSYLSSHPKPDWTFAGSESNETQALIPLVRKEHLLAGGLSDSSGQCTGHADTLCPSQFLVGDPQVFLGEAIAKYIEDHHYGNVGILQDSLDASAAIQGQVKKSLEAAGVKVTVATFPITAVSVTPEVAKLKSAGAQVLSISALGPAAGYAAKARSELGWNVPAIYDVVASSQDITKVAPTSQLMNSVEEVFRPENGSLTLPGLQPMLDGMKPYGGLPPGAAVNVAAFAWDEFVALHEAAAQAGSTDQAALISAENNLSSSASTNSFYLLSPKTIWTTTVHNNNGAAVSDLYFVPVGPLVNGQVASTSSSASSSS
jgi:ABC-type branched-subunit amino acid transport system substrate-binding protein